MSKEPLDHAFRRLADWQTHDSWQELTPEVLREITATEGIDFATSLLYDRLLNSPDHGPMIARLHTHMSAPLAPRKLNARVLIAPGAFYREYPHTGGDGRLVREVAAEFGCVSELMPFSSFGRLEENARILIEGLNKQSAENLILVSLSKGGADVKMALRQPGAETAFSRVVAWISLCGLVNGTPLVPWIKQKKLRELWYRFLLWLRGYDFRTVEDMDHRPGEALDVPFDPPPHWLIVHVVGFPLRQHLTNGLARRCHRRLEHLGPNDGAGIILAELPRLPGRVFPVWGADHYLRPAGADLKQIARSLFHFVGESLHLFEPMPAKETV